MKALLEARNVTKKFSLGGVIHRKYVTAVEDFSFMLEEDRQKVVTLAGESGSGKTTITSMLLGFTKPTTGQVLYRDKDIWHLKASEWRRYRKEVQAVFQDPYECLNPFYKVDHVLVDATKKLKIVNSDSEAVKLANEALEQVGLNPSEILKKYPHQLSGGQRQRVLLARGFILKPKVLLADEPVSMIDASLRADILKIIQKLEKDFEMSCLYITHDLSNAFCISDEIILLYLGSIMEQGKFETILSNPKHPYVKMLINAIPIPDPKERWKQKVNLQDIEIARLGTIIGCKFCNRCEERMPICSEKRPPLLDLGKKHRVACHLYG